MKTVSTSLLCLFLFVNISTAGASRYLDNPNSKKANHFFLYSKYDSASFYYNQALNEFEKENEYSGVSTCLNRLGEIQNIKGNNNLA